MCAVILPPPFPRGPAANARIRLGSAERSVLDGSSEPASLMGGGTETRKHAMSHAKDNFPLWLAHCSRHCL